MNLKLLVMLVMITFTNISGLFFINSFDLFEKIVTEENKDAVVNTVKKSEKEVFVHLYGINISKINSSYISKLYLEYNIKLVREVDMNKADIIIADYDNIKEYFGKFDILTFTDPHQNEIVMFNKDLNHTPYIDIVFYNLYYFKQNIITAKRMISYVDGKILELKLIKDNISFIPENLLKSTFFDKTSPIFSKEMKDFPSIRVILLGIFQLIILFIILIWGNTIFKNSEDYSSYNFGKDFDEMFWPILVIGFIIYFLSPF